MVLYDTIELNDLSAMTLLFNSYIIMQAFMGNVFSFYAKG